MSYIVELEPGVWLAAHREDPNYLVGRQRPGRTVYEDRADTFPTMHKAAAALTAARESTNRRFDRAAITGC